MTSPTISWPNPDPTQTSNLPSLDALAMQPGVSADQGDSSLAPATKRRKLRNGTTSCWECKRRKARCSFADAGTENSVCDGCMRRGTPCISQDLPDHPAPTGSNRHLVDRLGKVEAVVDRLLRAASNNEPPPRRPASPSPHPGDSQSPPEPATAQVVTPGIPSAIALGVYQSPLSSLSHHDNSVHDGWPGLERSALPSPGRTQQSTTSPNLGDQPTHPSDKFDSVRKELLAVWPSQKDLDIILSVPIDTCSVVRGVCNPIDGSSGLILSSPQTLLQLPPPDSHPVLIAQKLLILGTYLQGLPSSSVELLQNLSTERRDIMARIIDKTHNLVTSNDELIASIEGVECVMLETLYRSYSGRLRLSWLASRRAVTIAQMLGLHQNVQPISLLGATCKPDHVWFRLVQLDRYLSMMLGLPQMSLDDDFARREVLESCDASERMHRLNCVAAGRLLRRSPADLFNSAMTRDIDKILDDASSSLPAQWWVTPTLSSCEEQTDTIRKTLRFHGHFMHYHLLLHLHLPYLLRPDLEPGSEYNRMTAITASREILTRFLSFRTSHSGGCYCRGVDLLAFVASTALGLAHIRDRRRGENDKTGFHFLSHQRLSDRGLLEHTLKSVQKMERLSGDDIATTVASLLQHLLAIEEDASAGGNYLVTSSPGRRTDEEPGYSVKLSEDGAVLAIRLPHIRSIRIERVPRCDAMAPAPVRENTTLPDLSQDSNCWHEINQERMPTSVNANEAQVILNMAAWGDSSAQLMPSFPHDTCHDVQATDQVFMADQWPSSLEGTLQNTDISFFDSLVSEAPLSRR